MQKISRLILKWFGWKLAVLTEEPQQSVVCVAPHTSNWDFILGKLSYWAIGRKASFLIKKSWCFFPLNYIFSALGGVPIDRSQSSSITNMMAEKFSNTPNFHLAITPEGTRKQVDKWKMGFYYIALKAKVPIEIAYFDYAKKEVGIKAVFTPTGDELVDIELIRTYYEDVSAKFPLQFKKIAK